MPDCGVTRNTNTNTNTNTITNTNSSMSLKLYSPTYAGLWCDTEHMSGVGVDGWRKSPPTEKVFMITWRCRVPVIMYDVDGCDGDQLRGG